MNDTKKPTLTTTFLATLLLLALTLLRFITLGPLNLTAIHIPIVTGSVVLRLKIGSILDGTLGIISLTKNTTVSTPLSFTFSPFVPAIGTDHSNWKALLVVLIPQILIGIVPYFVYKWPDKLTEEEAQPVSLFVASVLGSATNTILVTNTTYFLSNSAHAGVIDKTGTIVCLVIITTIFSSGVSEALVAGVAASAIASALLRLMKRNATQKL